MPLEEKRTYYQCGNNYVTLDDILPWQRYVKENHYLFAKKGLLERDAEFTTEHDRENKRVSLWKGDITCLEIDAIVNAANKSLRGGGGVDGCIHRAAGRGLLEECIKLNGCETGKAKITSGQKLPAKHVIHTVGPIGENQQKLESCYLSCLKLMKEHKLNTVAFCPISTGIYGYPSHKAAEVALKTVKRWLEENEDWGGRIIFCVFLQDDLETYRELMLDYFPCTVKKKIEKTEASGDATTGSKIKPKDEKSSSIESENKNSSRGRGRVRRNIQDREEKQPTTATILSLVHDNADSEGEFDAEVTVGGKTKETTADGKGGKSLIYSAAYFRARDIGEAKNARIPIIIVGKDRAGKSSLKKHLLGQPFDCQEPSTNGIDVDVVVLTDGNAADAWGKKETTFFTGVDEVEEKVLEHTVQLVMEKEELEEDDASPAVVPTLSPEVIDRIHELRIKNVARENPTTIFVHDFAGQSIFYDTHFCFLKTQCVYVLVIDLNSPLDELATPRFELNNSDGVLHDPFLETNLDYALSWLTVLERLSDFYSEISPDNHPEFQLPPVVIALTNSDQCKDKEIVKVKKRIHDILIQKAFPNVFTDIFVIDNTLEDRCGEEIRRLRQKLYDLCKKILDQQQPMPVRWLDLEVALGKKIVDERLMYISIEDCRAVAESCNVVDVDSAITFLHHQGIIVHHNESPVVVLNPPWLMNLFTEIISFPQEQETNPRDARFYKLLSEGILMQEYLQRNVHGEVLENLMKQFSLICPWEYDGNPAYIVPSVAPRMKKGIDVQKKLSESPVVSVFAQFSCSYVPLGFFTRFQINMMNTCKEDLLNETPQLYSNYTLLSFPRSEGWFDVYLIKVPGKIKVGVVPKDEQNERAYNEFVSYLKQVLEECMQKVIEEEPFIYGNITYSLVAKCSVSCCGKTETCRLRHGAAKCDRDDCGFFWSLKELETFTKDPFCKHGSVMGELFSLHSVRHWLNTGQASAGNSSSSDVLPRCQASAGNSSSSDVLPRLCIKCEDDPFVKKGRAPHKNFETKPSVFPLLSGKKIVGTAFVFEDDLKRCRVISWYDCSEPECRMIVKVNGKNIVRSITLRQVRENLVAESLLKESLTGVAKFKAATLSSEGTGATLFMAAREARSVCGRCNGLVLSRMSKRCHVKKCEEGRYVRESGRLFKSSPSGAPLVNGDGKLVAVVTGFEKDKVTVLKIEELKKYF